MGWFDEQIRQRIRDDEDILDEAYLNLSSVVLGKRVLAAALNDDKTKIQNAFEEILHCFHIKAIPVPAAIEDMNQRLEYLLHPAGIMHRTVRLEGAWYRDGIGPMIGRTAGGDTVALIPGLFYGYSYFNYETGKRVKVTKRNAAAITPEAICFYVPLPQGSLKVSDLFRYMARCLRRGDVVLIVLAGLGAALLGLVLPYATRTIFQQIVPSGRVWLLGSIATLMVGVAVSTLVMDILKNMLTSRVAAPVIVHTEAAMMMRMISMSAAFFKECPAGELATRGTSLRPLCLHLTQMVFSLGLSAVFSLAYLPQIFAYAPAMTLPALALIAVNVLWIFLTARAQMTVDKKKMEAGAKLDGLVYGLFSGLQKIKLSGAERRAFGKWAGAYKTVAEYTYDSPLLVKLGPPITLLLTMAGTILLYFCALRGGVAPADYLAFFTAYGQIIALLVPLAPAAILLGGSFSVLPLLEPMLRTPPEVSVGKRSVTRLSGGIELSNVSFRYKDDMPLILDNLSLKIKPGQYVAVVGSTGCGKSTLLRLLLGFEVPHKGAVYYDGKDLQSLDQKSLRQRIGVVLQNRHPPVGQRV